MTNRSAIRFVALCVFALVLLLAWQLKLSYESTLQRVTGDADNLAYALDGQITATFRRIESSLGNIAGQLPAAALNRKATTRHRPQVDAILRPYLRSFPEVTGFYVWDAAGDLLYDPASVFPLSGRRSIAERPGFQELKTNPQAQLAFSDSIRSFMTGQQTVAVYVPVRDAGGRLGAVVTATLNLDRFARVFESLQIPPASVIFMRRSDSHKMVIRFPYREGEVNKPVRNSIQRRIDAGETAGRDRFKAVTDGEYRLYGFRKIEGYPFYVVVGLAQEGAMAAWRKDAGLVAGGLLVMVAAMSWVLLRMRRMERLREQAQQEASHAHQLLQESIDSISAGLIIYDPDDRLVMCNEAQRQIFGGIRDVIVPGRSFEEITRAGAERGFFVSAVGHVEEWLSERIKQHRASDGQAHELSLADGRWVQFSEHRTPGGYIVGSRIDITQRKQLEAELQNLATRDALTGLPNRRHFMNRLASELDRVQRGTTQQASLLMLDLDHFKRINDTHGHAGGDLALKYFAEVLQGQLRGIDSCGRLGGEEFAVILPGADLEAAQHYAERLRRKLADSGCTIDAQRIQLTVSIGITMLKAQDRNADTVLSRADGALYRAKEAGRDQVQLA